MAAAGVEHGSSQVAALHREDVRERNFFRPGNSLQRHNRRNALHEPRLELGLHGIVSGGRGHSGCHHIDPPWSKLAGQLPGTGRDCGIDGRNRRMIGHGPAARNHGGQRDGTVFCEARKRRLDDLVLAQVFAVEVLDDRIETHLV
ncbi:hypothetical protein WCQ02_32405 [Paraburkholderia tropica]|nr:hypothetical protein [Paraburkholderia tropica]